MGLGYVTQVGACSGEESWSGRGFRWCAPRGTCTTVHEAFGFRTRGIGKAEDLRGGWPMGTGNVRWQGGARPLECPEIGSEGRKLVGDYMTDVNADIMQGHVGTRAR